MAEHIDPQAAYQSTGPDPDVQALDRLVGTWELSGDTHGRVTYEWMEGGFFLLQRVDFDHNGNHIQGLEVIGRLRLFGQAPSTDIMSRFYASSGDTLDYVYDLTGDTMTIWGGERDSPAYYQGTFSADGTTCTGAWMFPGGGGYSSTMTKVEH